MAAMHASRIGARDSVSFSSGVTDIGFRDDLDWIRRWRQDLSKYRYTKCMYVYETSSQKLLERCEEICDATMEAAGIGGVSPDALRQLRRWIADIDEHLEEWAQLDVLATLARSSTIYEIILQLYRAQPEPYNDTTWPLPSIQEVLPCVELALTNQYLRHRLAEIEPDNALKLIELFEEIARYVKSHPRLRENMSDATRQLYAQHLSLEQARTGDPRLPRQAGDHSTFLVSFLRIIGKGTYGKVYLVRNVTTNEAMALKRVDVPSSATHESNPRRASIPNSFSREVEMLTKLDHLNVVPYLGVDKMPTSLNIFFEYIPGGSIAGRLRKHGKLNEEVIKLFASQTLDGLEYLHSKDIIHGRLDSNHILLNKSDICKISLCISSITDRDSTVNVPFLGHGSALCMAPEMLTYSVTSLSSKVDIWGIGYVVYEMWSGRKQWNEQGGQTIEFHAKQGSLVPADVHLSPLAEDFLQKCFAIDPNERSTATELRKHPYLVPERTWMLNGLR